MRTKTILAGSIGLLVGAVVALTVPAVAHQGPAFERLRERVQRLEQHAARTADRVALLRTRTASLHSELDALGTTVAEHSVTLLTLADADDRSEEALSDQLEMIVGLMGTDELLNERIDDLDGVTAQLDGSGTYTGSVAPNQIDTPGTCAGQPAT
jgi:septal ring factor EnvC (AmiA/AmiB activator)